jgi:hypothetical protein
MKDLLDINKRSCYNCIHRRVCYLFKYNYENNLMDTQSIAHENRE